MPVTTATSQNGDLLLARDDLHRYRCFSSSVVVVAPSCVSSVSSSSSVSGPLKSMLLSNGHHLKHVDSSMTNPKLMCRHNSFSTISSTSSSSSSPSSTGSRSSPISPPSNSNGNQEHTDSGISSQSTASPPVCHVTSNHINATAVTNGVTVSQFSSLSSSNTSTNTTSAPLHRYSGTHKATSISLQHFVSTSIPEKSLHFQWVFYICQENANTRMGIVNTEKISLSLSLFPSQTITSNTFSSPNHKKTSLLLYPESYLQNLQKEIWRPTRVFCYVIILL